LNYWTQLSVEFANQRDYLDQLYRVYPVAPNLRRELPEDIMNRVETAFTNRDNENLIRNLLKLDLFPVKDSYVAFLRRDESSIGRNPQTINRIAGNLYAMGIDEIYDKCSEPKEANRQMGPMFKNWINRGVLGCPVFDDETAFLRYNGNAVFNSSDARMKDFATTYLGYTHDKGLDFIGKFNGKYVIGEAKFLTDFGGHQKDQFNDAINVMNAHLVPNRLGVEVEKIAILDGVLYITGGNAMYTHISSNDENIMSTLVLREYLYSL